VSSAFIGVGMVVRERGRDNGIKLRSINSALY